MIEVKLKAIKRLSSLYKRRVMVLDDWNGNSITLGHVELIKGSEDELPYWLANILEKRNIVKITDTVGVEDLGRILFQERQNVNIPASLVPLSRDYFQKIRFYLESLKKDNNIENIEKFRKSIAMINEIFKIRSRKIVQLAFLDISDQNIINSMTEEELLIYTVIRQIIRELYGDIIGSS
ncbi:MAG: hypothetical protein RRA45_07890 [Saccharolobus sp.]|uniref:hypothetical protein n=1 Tax=Saccharolobus sp. TaxID=2100761 RepID=UPI0028CD5815|nr:hypothetical protein [Saccharolobus sp.]MDT7862119.1 hypothetical protein [Saccharolobus sp.]